MTQPAPTLTATDLVPSLMSWLPGQRWFAGKQREISDLTPSLLAELDGGSVPVQIWLVTVRYADGGQECYQVPLSVHPEPEEPLAHALVAAIGDTGFVYEAMHDKAATPVWLHGIVAGAQRGPVRFHLTVDAGTVPLGAPSLVLSAEQSNTSTVFGDRAVLKLFRRVEPGLNPDVEVHEQLGRLGGKHIARLLGHVEATVDGERTSLAMLQEFLSTATDGWELAKISVRDLMAEADLHADEAGGDFAGEAYRLGAATAEVHGELAEAFGTSPISTEDVTLRAAAMNARLDDALRVVPHLAAMEPGLRALFAAFAAVDGFTVQRVHGDLHLGQVLRTVQRWVLIDFEGEPAKSIADRRTPDSVARDVAGMLRSFDYAARHQIIDSGSTPQQDYRAAEWSQRNREAFCDGYAHAAGTDPRDQGVLLRAFEADKAVYEAVYEARNRPSWLPVPLASLDRLATPQEDST